jgi:hypothetical protein
LIGYDTNSAERRAKFLSRLAPHNLIKCVDVQPRETHRARFLRQAAKQKKKTDPGKKTGKFMLSGALFRMEPKHNSLLLFQKFPTKFS